jgi:GNAT superfamily N-acetyltransferase
MRERLRIELLPQETAADAAVMSQLSDLINAVYQVAEEGFWVDGTLRTNLAEVTSFTEAGEIAVARLDGRIVGCLHLQRLGDGVSEFGMLTAAPEHRGIGVGRELVRFAERHGRAQGTRVMQLELLAPRTWSHPGKEFLAGWYERIGYRMIRFAALEEYYPHLKPLLATPCDLRVYHKDLEAGDGTA